MLRFWLGSVVGHKAGAPFWGTLFVNVTGCFLIGLLGVWLGAVAGRSLS